MNVSLSLNPMSVFEYFRNKGNRNRDQVADYLDQIANEAKALADVWDAVIKDFQLHQGRFNVEDHQQLLSNLEIYAVSNAPHFARLNMFYREVSKAAEGKLKPRDLDSVAMVLGNLLYQREVTLEKYQSQVQQLRASIFVAADNKLSDFQELSTLSAALHKEAAALDVLAKTIRVQLG